MSDDEIKVMVPGGEAVHRREGQAHPVPELLLVDALGGRAQHRPREVGPGDVPTHARKWYRVAPRSTAQVEDPRGAPALMKS